MVLELRAVAHLHRAEDFRDLVQSCECSCPILAILLLSRRNLYGLSGKLSGSLRKSVDIQNDLGQQGRALYKEMGVSE